MIEWLVAVAVAGAVLVCIICGWKVTEEAPLLNSGFVSSHPEPENQPELPSNQLTIDWVTLSTDLQGPHQGPVYQLRENLSYPATMRP